MSQQKRGRPIKNNKAEVNYLLVEFLAKKGNNYGAEMCYMKVVDKDARRKIKFITILEDGKRNSAWINCKTKT